MQHVLEDLILRLVSFLFGFVAGLMVGGEVGGRHEEAPPAVKSVGTAYRYAYPVETRVLSVTNPEGHP